MNTVPLEFDISTTDVAAGLGVRVILDSVVILDLASVSDPYHFSHDISDEDGEHELAIELYGKLPKHTVVDSEGNIINDAMLSVSNISIDGIPMDQVISEVAKYHHNYNGTQPETQDKFYGNMGCNGQLKLKFTTPIYLWLLENM
jgi:hypothetical protein